MSRDNRYYLVVRVHCNEYKDLFIWVEIKEIRDEGNSTMTIKELNLVLRVVRRPLQLVNSTGPDKDSAPLLSRPTPAVRLGYTHAYSDLVANWKQLN